MIESIQDELCRDEYGVLPDSILFNNIRQTIVGAPLIASLIAMYASNMVVWGWFFVILIVTGYRYIQVKSFMANRCGRVVRNSIFISIIVSALAWGAIGVYSVLEGNSQLAWSVGIVVAILAAVSSAALAQFGRVQSTYILLTMAPYAAMALISPEEEKVVAGWVMLLSCIFMVCNAKRMSVLFNSMRNMVEGGQKEIARLQQSSEALESLNGLLRERVSNNTAQISSLSNNDHLTQLVNRRSFGKKAQYLIEDGMVENSPIAVLLINIRDFKSMNDALGMDVGDAILINTAKILDGLVRDDAILCRWGADEFVACVPGLNQDQAYDLAYEIKHEVKQPFIAGSIRCSVDINVTIASFPEHATTVNELVRCADSAMVLLKRERTDAVSIFTEKMGTSIKESST